VCQTIGQHPEGEGDIIRLAAATSELAEWQTKVGRTKTKKASSTKVNEAF